jgi:enoyl-CoA hydratase/carnithine racemase
MTAPGVRFEVSGAVGRITLNRPEVSNAIDLPTARAFGQACSKWSYDGSPSYPSRWWLACTERSREQAWPSS